MTDATGEKAPPCDACGEPSCLSPIRGLDTSIDGLRLCFGCWGAPREATVKLAALRSTTPQAEAQFKVGDEVEWDEHGMRHRGRVVSLGANGEAARWSMCTVTKRNGWSDSGIGDERYWNVTAASLRPAQPSPPVESPKPAITSRTNYGAFQLYKADFERSIVEDIAAQVRQTALGGPKPAEPERDDPYLPDLTTDTLPNGKSRKSFEAWTAEQNAKHAAMKAQWVKEFERPVSKGSRWEAWSSPSWESDP